MTGDFFIVGPTASGKSSLALKLAQSCGGVICSVDAFQIYRGLDIGTGKVTAAERALAPHYLIDICDATAPFSVADYLRASERALMTIPPEVPRIWVGGTGLYVRALREGLTLAPESDRELVRELAAKPLAELQMQIRALDPVWCKQADLQNPRRVIRALAVVLATGKPLSLWQQERSRPLVGDAKGVFLLPERELGRTLIANRVRQMWESGWMDEVRGLLAINGWKESQSAKALGYLQVADFISGRTGQEECLEQIITLTAQYAKRQVTWFKAEPGFVTLPYAGETDYLLEQLVAAAKDNQLPES